MKLTVALKLDELKKQHSEHTIMISFLGGGGKTSSMLCLANELSIDGYKVLVTTTTAIYPPSARLRPEIDVLGDYITAEGKLKGISPAHADRLCRQGQYDFILVEADGSRGLPIKAPAEHEPVIPTTCAMVIGVIGADCFNSTIDEMHVHRPEYFTQITDSSYGEVITDNHLIRLISSPKGLFKGSPMAAKRVLLINKVVYSEQREYAKQLAGRVMSEVWTTDAVLIGAVQEASPIQAVFQQKTVCAVILAAGLSTRFGGKKLLTPIDHTPMARRVAELAVSTGFRQILFVYSDKEVADTVSRLTKDCPDFIPVFNPDAAQGLSTSVRAALTAAMDTDAYLFFVGDQPFLDCETVYKIIEAYQQSLGSIIVPLYEGRRGNPVLFDAKWKSQLLTLTGDVGGREIIRDHPIEVYELAISNPLSGMDIDTQADYAAFKRQERN